MHEETGRTGAGVLVTGGAGYIGSHTAKALAEAGHRPVVFDNLSSGFREACLWGDFVHGDIRDFSALTEVIEHHQIKAVIHFASLIEVGKSVERPDLFWDVNVHGTRVLLSAMQARGVPRIVFSSSAAVYGGSLGEDTCLLAEETVKAPASPYGATKLACERMISDFCRAFNVAGVALRYFNAAGADASGSIGEAHQPETHLIPNAIKAALGQIGPLTVFGDDFDTPDGTCVRDYVHVTDLALAHLAALETHLVGGEFEAVNAGTGQGFSVAQVIAAVADVVGQKVPYVVGRRRLGDPPRLVACARKSQTFLNWRAHVSDLPQIVRNAVAWHRCPRFGVAGDPCELK